MSTKQTTFVRMREINEPEGEAWNWWLELDGNEVQIGELAELISRAANDGEGYDDFPYELILADHEPESVVDKLVQYAEDGYYSSHNKVSGLFTCPDSLGQDADRLYKGGILDLFLTSSDGS